MAHVTVPSLTTSQLASLKQLYRNMPELKQPVEPLHLGDNGLENPSIFQTVHWFDMTRKQRHQFKEAFPDAIIQRAVNGWFLRFPKRTGRLDRMTHWVGQPLTGSVVSYSLADNQVFSVDDVEMTFNAGDGVGFALNQPHEVKPSKDGQRWACVLIVGDPAQLV